jgi:hypothetical protein
MSLADRVLRRFLAAQEPVRQQIGPFTVEYPPTLAATVPKVGDALLELQP